MKKWFKSINIFLALAVIASLMQYIVELSPIYWNWVTNSDQLTIPQFTSDILNNPLRIQGWQLSRAPYFFPDSIVAIIANIFTNRPQNYLRVQGFLFLFLQLIIVSEFMLIFINRKKILPLFMGISVWISMPLLFNQLPGQFAQEFIVLQVSNATHFSSILLVLLLITFCELAIFSNERTSVSLRVLTAVMAITCYLGALSNKLFAALSFPLMFMYLLMTFLIREESTIRLRWKKIFVCLSLFSIMLGYLSENFLNRQPDTFSMTHQLIFSNIHTIFNNLAASFVLFSNTTILPTSIIILAGTLYVLVILVVWGIKVKKYRNTTSTLREAIAKLILFESSTRLQICCFLSTALGLLGPLSLNADVYTARYYTPVFYFPLAHLAVITGNALSTKNNKRSSFILKIEQYIDNLFYEICIISCVIFFLYLLTVRSYNSYLLDRIDQAQSLSKCVNSHGLKTGAASYWVARKMNFLSNGHLNILPVSPSNLDHGYFYWGTNIYDILDCSHDFKTISYFVFQGDNNLTSMTDKMGSEKIIDCAGLKVIVYDNSELTSNHFYKNSFNFVLDRTKFLRIPPSYLPCTTGSDLSRNRVLDITKNKLGYAFYGLYIRAAKGKYHAGMKIYLFTSQESHLGDVVGKFDVVYGSGSVSLSQTEIFWKPGRHDIELAFSIQKEIPDLEIRFLWYGMQNGMIEDIIIESKEP